MDVSSLKGRLPREIIESITARGISELTPPQEDAIDKGLLERKNLVIASPTASGKTLVAEMACVNSILSSGKKGDIHSSDARTRHQRSSASSGRHTLT